MVKINLSALKKSTSDETITPTQITSTEVVESTLVGEASIEKIENNIASIAIETDEKINSTNTLQDDENQGKKPLISMNEIIKEPSESIILSEKTSTTDIPTTGATENTIIEPIVENSSTEEKKPLISISDIKKDSSETKEFSIQTASIEKQETKNPLEEKMNSEEIKTEKSTDLFPNYQANYIQEETKNISPEKQKETIIATVEIKNESSDPVSGKKSILTKKTLFGGVGIAGLAMIAIFFSQNLIFTKGNINEVKTPIIVTDNTGATNSGTTLTDDTSNSGTTSVENTDLSGSILTDDTNNSGTTITADIPKDAKEILKERLLKKYKKY